MVLFVLRPVLHDSLGNVGDGCTLTVRSADDPVGCLDPVAFVDEVYLQLPDAVPSIVCLLLLLVATFEGSPILCRLSSTDTELIFSPQ
jgi:hypothetical protein